MGTWGTAISSNDTYADVYGDFFDHYNDGLIVKEVAKKLIADNQETINDPDDSNNFWFALAKAQWECKELDPPVFDRVKKIIRSGSDIEIWRQLGATEKDIEKRKIVLDKFVAELQTERPKAKPRKKQIIRQPVFEKGDCLIFKHKNGNYGGAVVLEAIRDTEYGHNLIATTRINQLVRPTEKDFETADVLILNHGPWDNKPNVKWYNPISHKQSAHLIEKIGEINVGANYTMMDYKFGLVSNFEIWFIQQVEMQFDSEKEKPEPLPKLKLKELTRK